MIEYVQQRMKKMHNVHVHVGTRDETIQASEHMESLGFSMLAMGEIPPPPREVDTPKLGYWMSFHRDIPIASTENLDKLTLDGRYTLNSEYHKEVHNL